MGTDFRVRPTGPRTLGAARRAGDRHTEIGRLPITCPDRQAIAAAVPGLLFSSGANITESRQHSAHPFGENFFLRIESRLTGLAKRFDDLPASFGEIAYRFSVRWLMTGTGLAKGCAR